MDSRAVAASLLRINNRKKGKVPEFRRRSERMSRCASYLVFGDVVDEETGEVTKKLEAAEFCRDRLCPMCSWRKSLVMFSQMSALMDRVDADHPGEYIAIFGTFTVKNCKGADLPETITILLRAWSRMMSRAAHRRPWCVTRGWFRALEVTYNAKTDEWHPHIHAILLVDSDYFGNRDKYIDQPDWVSEWKWALGVDYRPSVDVRTIKHGRDHAVAEVSKYAVKPGEWLDPKDDDGTDARVELLAMTLKGRRLVAYGGVMKDTRKALKQEDAETADLVHTTDDVTLRGDLVVALDRYEWQVGVTNYVHVKHDKLVPGEHHEGASA